MLEIYEVIAATQVVTRLLLTQNLCGCFKFLDRFISREKLNPSYVKIIKTYFCPTKLLNGNVFIAKYFAFFYRLRECNWNVSGTQTRA